MTTLTDFLLARITEDEAALNHDDCQSLGLHIITVQAADRWTAECEAKRRIIGYLSARDDYADQVMLQILALPYADHPDYRDEWRPV